MATSGYILGTVTQHSDFYRAVLYWNRVSVDIPNNTSTIRIYSMIEDYPLNNSNWDWKGTVNSSTFTMNVDGQTYTKTGTIASNTDDDGTTGAGWTYAQNAGPLGSGWNQMELICEQISPTYQTFVIPHNADGTKTVSVTHTYQLPSYTYGPGNVSFSGSFTLDSIPRASTITAFSVPDIAGAASVNISATTTSYSNTFNLDFKLAMGASIIVDYGAVAGWTNITASGGSGQTHTLALTAAQQDAILALIPSSTSATLTLYCRTQSGTTDIGSPLTRDATVNVASTVVPTLTSVTAAELSTSPNINTIVSKYVQGLSNARLTINGAAGAKSSTITGYTIRYLSVDYSGSATIDTGVMTWSGSTTVRGTVTDSRGRTAYSEMTLAVLAYYVPGITTFTVQRCNSGGTLDEVGTYAKVVRAATAASLINSTEKNTIAAKVYYKDRAGVTPAAFTELTNMTVSASSSVTTAVNNTAIVSATGILDITKSYDFKFEVIDRFNTTLSYLTVSTGTVVMAWGTKSVGIGVIPGDTGTYSLEVGGAVNTTGVFKNGVEITSGTTDHGALGGLGDDDHTQYHNDARGDARYQAKDNTLTSLAAVAATAANDFIVADGTDSWTKKTFAEVAGILGKTGTWTPTYKGSTTAGTWTYSNRLGYYARIGPLVFFSARITTSASSGSPTGNWLIDGLPYTCVNACSAYGSWSNITYGGSVTQISPQVAGGQKYLTWTGVYSGGTWSTMTVSLVSSGTKDVQISGMYYTNDSY
jgi:hypothetical protein